MVYESPGLTLPGWWLSPTPLKNDGVGSSVGMMKFPTEWKFIIHPCSKPPICVGCTHQQDSVGKSSSNSTSLMASAPPLQPLVLRAPLQRACDAYDGLPRYLSLGARLAPGHPELCQRWCPWRRWSRHSWPVISDCQFNKGATLNVCFRSAVMSKTHTGWWCNFTILKNMKVNGKDYPIHYGK